MTSTHTPTPSINVALDKQLLIDDGKGEFLLAKEGALHISLNDAATVAEMREGLRKMLNVWDINAPRWLWQLDSFLDPISRDLASKEYPLRSK
jgi:hypothetical protein